MKVIFLEDLPKVAYAGEMKEVADGYARNYLIPKKIAVIVKPGTVNVVAARQVKMVTALEELAGKLEGVEVNLTARAGTKERLYGSITAADITAELNRITGLDIDKRKLDLDKPIHQLGIYEIAIKLAKDIAPKITVYVTGEESDQDKTAITEEKDSQPTDTTTGKAGDEPAAAITEEASDDSATTTEDSEQPAPASEEETAPPDDTKTEE